MPERRSRRAALLDRDGTIIVDRDYTRDPDDLQLLPGAADAIKRLAAAGYPAIVFTNQSGIARGLVTFTQYRAVRRRFEEMLRAEGAILLDTFTCPHHPEFDGACDCRKPLPAMYVRAARMHDLDLSRCLFIGDRDRDVAVARRYNGRAALIRSPRTGDEDVEAARREHVPLVDSLAEATDLLIGGR